MYMIVLLRHAGGVGACHAFCSVVRAFVIALCALKVRPLALEFLSRNSCASSDVTPMSALIRLVKRCASITAMCVSLRAHCAGLFAASLALHLAAPAQRLAPEALTFAVRALRCATPDQAARPASARNPAPERDPAAPKWLLPAGGWGCADLGSGRGVPPLEVGAALATAPGDAYFGSDAFRASALAAAMALLVRAAQVFGKAAALPELLAPAARALRALGAAGLPQVSRMPGLRVRLGLYRGYRTL